MADEVSEEQGNLNDYDLDSPNSGDEDSTLNRLRNVTNYRAKSYEDALAVFTVVLLILICFLYTFITYIIPALLHGILH